MKFRDALSNVAQDLEVRNFDCTSTLYESARSGPSN
jgi:hypothetical protein